MKHFRNIFVIQLAILMVLSTFTFTVDTHYCGDFLVDVSVLGKADGCGMETDTTSMKNCCNNESQQFVGQDELQLQVVDIPVFTQSFLIAFHFYNQEVEVVQKTKKEILFEEFSPPDITKNYQTSHQVFII